LQTRGAATENALSPTLYLIYVQCITVIVCHYSIYVIHAQFGFIMPPPKLAGGEHSVFGSLVRPLSVNTYFL